MKHLITSFCLALMFAFTARLNAQVPQGINYQAVVRNAQGEIMANHAVMFTFSITPAPNSNLLYAETQQVTTNEFGLVNLVVGTGTPTYSTFDALTWDIPYALFTQLTIDGNTIDMGAQALQSVPYALNAASAMTLSPDAAINANQIAGGNATTNQVLQFNGTDWVPANLPAGNGGEFDLPYAETDTYDAALLSVMNNNWNAIEGFSINGMGLYGSSSHHSGVSGISSSDDHGAVSGFNYENGPGVKGNSDHGSGVMGVAGSGNGYGVLGINNYGDGIRGISDEPGRAGIVGLSMSTYASGLFGIAHDSSSVAVKGWSMEGTAIAADGYVGADIYGTQYGIKVQSGGTGLVSQVSDGNAIYAMAGSGNGIISNATTGDALRTSTTTGTSIYTRSDFGNALETNGKVKIAGISQAPAQGKVLTSDANGNATWQGAIAFAASGGGNQTITDYPGQKVLFVNEDYDFGDNFNTTTREFTVPVHGVYHFDILIDWIYSTDDFNGNVELRFIRNGVTQVMMTTGQDHDTNGHHHEGMSCEFELLPGDKVFVQVFISGDDEQHLDTNDFTRFSGRLVLAL